jgi:hypothetical protein
VAPETLQAVILAGFGREDVDQQVAVIGQHPFGLVVTLDADGQLAGLLLQLEADFVADGLNLARVGAGRDDEEIGERGDAGEVQNQDVGGFLGFGGADGNEPGGGGGLDVYAPATIVLQ